MSETTKTSGIGGKVRESQFDDSKYVGLAEVEVIAINPNIEEYKELLGIELKEDSKAAEYLGESKDGNQTVRIDLWVQRKVKDGKFKKDKITFFLEDKARENKDGTKTQYINTLGSCSWASDPNDLPEWFAKREYRVAYNGEEDLYNCLRTWLGNLDYRDAETVLQLEWKQLMKGNVRDLKAEIGGEYATKFVALYTVKTVDKDGEVKEYQSIYNKAFLPSYSLKNFRLVDYTKPEVLDGLRRKKSSDLKPHERFALSVTGEHGCKDSFILKDIKEYNPEDFLVASNEPLAEDDPGY